MKRRFSLKSLLMTVVILTFAVAWISQERLKYAKCNEVIAEIRQHAAPHEYVSPYYEVTNPIVRLVDLVRGRQFNGLILEGADAWYFETSLDPQLFSKLNGIEELYAHADDTDSCIIWARSMPDLKCLSINVLQGLDSLQKLTNVPEFQGLDSLIVEVEGAGPTNIEIQSRVFEFPNHFPNTQVQVVKGAN